MEWRESSGKGILYFFITFTSPKMAYPAYELPYSVVLVEMEEGPRICANTHEIDPDELEFGMPMEAMFDDLWDGTDRLAVRRRGRHNMAIDIIKDKAAIVGIGVVDFSTDIGGRNGIPPARPSSLLPKKLV